jgi:16S rRNA (cytosine1402-N4)-methyltransferase
VSAVATHVPVLVAEVLAALAPAAGGVLLDGTVGLGGHAEAWLDACARAGAVGRVVGLDRDPEALALARQRLEAVHPGRALLVHASYERAPQAVRDADLDQVDAALLDLGVSSLQLDDPRRGFSLQAAGPLDMRTDPGQPGPTAADVVNQRSEEQLARVFAELGEEPATAGGRHGRRHPATRVFQALRLEVNDELGRLARGLPRVVGTVRVGGRLAVVSFHRLEDREVKRFLRRGELAGALRLLGDATAARQEQRANPRSRSARLRAAEVLGSVPPSPEEAA